MQTRQKYAGRFADSVGDYRSLSLFEIKRDVDKIYRDLKQFFGKRYQFSRRQAAMPFVHRLGQRIGDTRPNSDHCGLLDTEFRRDRVGSFETDPADVTRKAVG